MKLKILKMQSTISFVLFSFGLMACQPFHAKSSLYVYMICKHVDIFQQARAHLFAHS